jgi:hypothetical protein
LKVDVHFDMETADPDDAMTLAWLATHPKVSLRGVTVTPGGRDQVRLVRTILDRLENDQRTAIVGALDIDDGKQRVSGFHDRWLPGWKESCAGPDGTPVEVMRQVRRCWPETTLLTGAPLRNVIDFFDSGGDFFRHWTCQGGFAGNNVVDDADQLPKFRGMKTCPTWNLGGSPGAERLFHSRRVGLIRFVSKNVCHGVVFGPAELDWVNGSSEKCPPHAGLSLVLQGMEVYMERKPQGKALHDLVAAVAMADPHTAQWRHGMPFKEKGKWGWDLLEEDDPDPPPPRYITTKVNPFMFLQGLIEK